MKKVSPAVVLTLIANGVETFASMKCLPAWASARTYSRPPNVGLVLSSLSYDPGSGLAGILFAIVFVEISGQSVYRVYAGFWFGYKLPITRSTDPQQWGLRPFVDNVKRSFHRHSFPQPLSECQPLEIQTAIQPSHRFH